MATESPVKSNANESSSNESVVNRVAHAASDGLHQASESAQFAYMRADECISKRPTESVITGFVAGVALGAIVTALCMRSTPPPSAWGRLRDHSWR